MQTLYKLEKDTAISERKEFLKHELKKMGVNVTPEGRDLEEVGLYTLEWNYVVAKNEKLREGSKNE